MNENINTLPLTLEDIAQHKNMSSVRDVLAALIPYDIINSYVCNVTHIDHQALKVPIANITIPILGTYLRQIFIKGGWSGNQIDLPIQDAITEEYRLGRFTFSENICISIDDLFVYENDLADIEDQKPDIFVHIIKSEEAAEHHNTSSCQQIQKLIDPSEIIQQIESTLPTIALSPKERRYITALLERLSGKTYKDCYLEANKNTQSDDPKTWLDQGKRYCNNAHKIVKEKMKIDFEISLIKGHMD